jgi:hypothetical protein
LGARPTSTPGPRRDQLVVSSNYKHNEWLLVTVWDLEKKKSTDLGQFDYLQDLNMLLFSNVVDQATQKTEYYLAYYMGGGDKQGTSSSRHWHGIYIDMALFVWGT